ncbi:MAG: FecR family protein [Mucilaginibacter sp.]|nr:FecR family protein [Mucilaginibacter sp.]
MKKHQAKNLLTKYVKGETTAHERTLLEQWFLKDLEDSKHVPSQSRIEEADERITAYLMSHIGLQQTETKITKIWPRIAVAAAALILIFGSLFFLRSNFAKQQIVKNTINDIAPGSNKAVLTLANGKSIVLDNSQNGLIAKQGVTVINKSIKGELVYKQAESNEVPASKLTYNLITIPRGAMSQVVVLPDGSKVWINAASSLRYPTVFAANERKVELTGEAYFEVAHNPAKPFKVVSNNQTVEVLGTHFNINSYNDEPGINTTLLQGSVRIMANGNEKVLKPGQQSTIKNGTINLSEVDVSEVVAWKDGYFEFSNTDIQSAVRQISRWYDVEMQCEGHINDETLTGRISRSRNISEVLQMFQQSKNINITITGRRIMVKE